MLVKESKIYNVICWLIGVVFVYGNGSLLSLQYRGIANILVVLSILILILFNLSRGTKTSSPNIIIFFLALFPFLGLFYYYDQIHINIISIIYAAIVYSFLSLLSLKDLRIILDRYALIIYYLACFSIFFGIIFLVDYSLIQNFPLILGDDIQTGGFYNLYIYTDRIGNDFRTQGIYWEPGAWAVNIAFSLFWFLYVEKRYKKSLVLIIAMLLAFSTSGLLLLVILLISVVFYARHLINKKVIITLIAVSALVLIVFAYITVATNVDIYSIIESSTTGKFDKHNISYVDRKETTLGALKLAIDNFFIGVGKQTFENSLFVTSAIVEVAYQLGMIYMFVYITTFIFLFRNMGVILGTLFGLVLLNAEAYAFGALFSLILIYNSKTLYVSHVKKNNLESF